MIITVEDVLLITSILSSVASLTMSIFIHVKHSECNNGQLGSCITDDFAIGVKPRSKDEEKTPV